MLIKKEGNWTEDGPNGFAKFIGNQVSKLVQLHTGEDGIFSKKSNFHSNIAYVLYSIFSQ